MTGSRLTVNPYDLSPPDFASPPYNDIRASLIAGRDTISDDTAAAAFLLAGWKSENASLRSAWDAQVLADNEVTRQHEDARLAQLEQDRLAAERALEDQRKEEEKKRPKFVFAPGSAVPDTIRPHPSPYAMNKIANAEYVETWYFTQEGCEAASAQLLSSSTDAFGIIKAADSLALAPVAAHKPLRNAVRDETLTWRQFSMGSAALIEAMQQHLWDRAVIEQFIKFKYDIENHPSRSDHFGEQALILYYARVRRLWMDAFKMKAGFRIDIFNDNLLREIKNHIWENAHANAISRVSLHFHLLDLYLPPFLRVVSNVSQLFFLSSSPPFPSLCFSAPLRLCSPAPMHPMCHRTYAPMLPCIHASRRLPASSRVFPRPIAFASLLRVYDLTYHRSAAPLRPCISASSHTCATASLYQTEAVPPSPSGHLHHYAPYPPPRSVSSSVPYRRSSSPTRSPPTPSRDSTKRLPRRDEPPIRRTSRDSFQSGAGSSGLSVCAICLGRNAHNVAHCRLRTFWSGSLARCTRNEQGRIVNPSGVVLCSDWQSPHGCTIKTHDSKHECSGCGGRDHGAQRCSLAAPA